MTRSKNKIIFFNKNNKITNKKLKINSSYLNTQQIEVHTGNTTQQVVISKYTLGFNLGEFVLNKKVIKHAKSLQRSSKKVQKSKINKTLDYFKKKYIFLN